jgi:hypothetical protein
LFLELGGLRNDLNHGISFSQPLARLNAIAGSWRISDRSAAGIGLSQPFRFRQDLSIDEITYEYFVGVDGYSAYTEVSIWQLTSAIAYKPTNELALGAAVDVFHYRVNSEEQIGNNHYRNDGRANVIALRFGWLLNVAQFSCGFVYRSRRSFDVDYRDADGNLNVTTHSKLPMELSVAVDWRRRVGIEYTRTFSDREGRDIEMLGGGVRMPLLRAEKIGTLRAAVGLRYRFLPDSWLFRRPDQTFITGGIELDAGAYRAAVTVINGHWLSDARVQVSEVVVSILRAFGH